MTTSGRARKPPGRRPAGADTTRGAVQSPDAAADGKRGKAPWLMACRRLPMTLQLRQEIERTREQLGKTVEQLAAKADVKSRGQAKAAEVFGRVKATAGRAQQEAAAQAEKVPSQLADKTAAARQKAASVGGAGKGRVAAVGKPVWEATPEPLRRAAAKGASGARERRVPLAVAAGLLIGGYLVIRWWRKR